MAEPEPAQIPEVTTVVPSIVKEDEDALPPRSGSEEISSSEDKTLPAKIPASTAVEEDEVSIPPRCASEELKSTEDKSLQPPQKDRSNSHCFGSPISALLNKLRRQSSYDMRQPETEAKASSSSPGLLSSTQDGMSRAARRSIHGLTSAFASLRGKKEAETVYVHNFVSPTLFLYGKDLKQAASKKLAEWDKLDARVKEEKEMGEPVTRHFIVDCSAFIFLDNAGAASMAQTYREMSARNIKVYYAAARESVRSFFLDLEEADRVPPAAFYPTVDCATQVAKAYRDSPPHITVSGLGEDDGEDYVDEDSSIREDDGEDYVDENKQEINSEEEETVSRH